MEPVGIIMGFLFIALFLVFFGPNFTKCIVEEDNNFYIVRYGVAGKEYWNGEGFSFMKSFSKVYSTKTQAYNDFKNRKTKFHGFIR